MKITVLAGGYSPERDVSLTSGALISSALIRKGHHVAYVDVYFGVSCPDGDFDSLFTNVPPECPKIRDTAPDLAALKAAKGDNFRLIGDNVLELCRASDVVFLALHGGMGEDGRLQATLESYGINYYTGSDFIGSALAMDKDLSKKVLASEGIRVPVGTVYSSGDISAEKILNDVGLPCVIKPTSCGSSVGVSIVHNEAELQCAIDEASVFECKIVVEKKIEGREFSVGVLGDIALPAIEIITDEGFYDYKNKYSGKTKEVCPAELTHEQASEAEKMALDVFRALRLSGYARVDVMLDSRDGLFYCLEANTLPGMTPNSLLPQEARAMGIDYDELCERIVESARKKLAK